MRGAGSLALSLAMFVGATAVGAATVVERARVVRAEGGERYDAMGSRAADGKGSWMGVVKGAHEEKLRLTGEDALTGGEISLELAQGQKHWVLAFVSVRCLCSPDQLLALKDLDTQFTRQGFKFIAIDVSQDSTQEERRKYYRDFSFPILRDQGFKLSDRFAAKKTPWIQVLNAAGKSVYTGTVLDQDGNALLEPALSALAAGREPARVKDKRFGCAIRTMVMAPEAGDDDYGAEFGHQHDHGHEANRGGHGADHDGSHHHHRD